MISNFKFQISNCSRGFSLIELMVVVAIVSVLSGIVLFSTKNYINNGKDSNIAGNMVTLIPGGEIWYNGNSNSYDGFCNPGGVGGNGLLKNVISQMTKNPSNDTGCYDGGEDPLSWEGVSNPAGLCCFVKPDNFQSWASCAQKFSDNSLAFCVDSRGVKKDIDVSNCDISNPIYSCQ